MQNEFVIIKALTPIVGSYVCKIADADVIVDTLTDDEHGNVIKKRQGRKRFRALIDVERQATVAELEAAIEGRLPQNITLLGPVPKRAAAENGEVMPVRVRVEAAPIMVPKALAEDFVTRGMAEIVQAKGKHHAI